MSDFLIRAMPFLMAIPLTAMAFNVGASTHTANARAADNAIHLAGEADVVIANILTNPLKVLAPALAGRVRRGGSLTLSGILDSQADEVIRTYAPHIKLTVWQRRDGWVCLSGTKP